MAWPFVMGKRGARLGVSKRELVWSRQRGRCALCGEPCARDRAHPHHGTIDHIVARYDGGTDELENLQLLGRSCHNVKDADVHQRACGPYKPKVYKPPTLAEDQAAAFREILRRIGEQ